MGSAYSKTNEDFMKTPIHETKFGKVRGKKYKIESERYANVFLGIPYAKPPVGELRFKKPEPPERWSKIRECIRYAPRAPQVDNMFDRLSMQVPTSEDCLYLNVFAPDWDLFEGQEDGRAVLVWIHGGGFTVQSAANYGYHGICKYLCSKGVIVVTLQYRLGILGFSTTGDENSIPNLGLWDQACALKWVNENIQYFGGNPDNITVFGQSAGAVCADILSLSPYTRGLFDKVIPMGGSANCSWAIRDTRRVRDATLSHAYSLGWQLPDNATEETMNESVMKFLREQPAKLLALGLPNRKFKATIAGLSFGPVIDGDFIPEPIAELRKKTPRKHCMTGSTDYEVLLYAFNNRIKYDAKKAENLLNEFVPRDKYCADYQQIRHFAKQLYFNDKSKAEEVKRAYFKIASDLFVTNGVHDYAEDMTNSGHVVYLYNFEYYSPRVFGVMRWTATHDTEIPYLFGKGLVETFRPNSMDLQVIDTFTTMFTNFAKYGEPNGGTIDGLRNLTYDNVWRYIRIAESVQMKNEFQGRRAEFWRNLREGKFLHEMNTKGTQTDDEGSGTNSDKTSSIGISENNQSTQITSHSNSYDAVAVDEDTISGQKLKLIGGQVIYADDQPVLLRYDELQYCSIENIKNELLNQSLNRSNFEENSDQSIVASEDHVTSEETKIEEKKESEKQNYENAALARDYLLVEDNKNETLNNDRNSILKKAEEVSFEEISATSDANRYYDEVDITAVDNNEDEDVSNDNKATELVVGSPVDGEKHGVDDVATDDLCQEILRKREELNLQNSESDMKEKNLLDEQSSGMITAQTITSLKTTNDSPVSIIEAATQTSVSFEESDEEDGERPPTPIAKNPEASNNQIVSDESDWDEFEQSF